MTGVLSAESTTTIACSSLPTNGSSGSYNFSYGIWFYLDDWSYKYGKEKMIFGVCQQKPSTSSSVYDASDNVLFSITMGKTQNDLEINILLDCSGAVSWASPGRSCAASTNTNLYTIIPVTGFSLQQWNYIVVSTNGSTTMDIYMNGKLTNTAVIPSTINTTKFSTSTIYITPATDHSTQIGFAGWTSLFSYWNHSLDPQTVWNYYKKGYGGSILGNFNYSVNVSISKGNDTIASGSL